MSKLIIQNDTNLSDEEAISHIAIIIQEGRISNSNKQYCYHTAFKDGISVSTFLNNKSDRFVISNE